MPSKLEQVLDLMNEGHRLWENGRLDDALSIMKAAVDIMPELPDPWIDVAGIYRAKNKNHNHEDLELRALDADRKLVSLGADEPELLADVTLARRRVAHRESWDRHLENHVAEETEKNKREKTLKLAEMEKQEPTIRANISQKKAARKKAIAAAKKAHWKSLSWADKRMYKKHGIDARDQYSQSHPMTIRARSLEHEIDELEVKLIHLESDITKSRALLDYPAPILQEIDMCIKYFDRKRHAGARCICGVRLNENPPAE